MRSVIQSIDELIENRELRWSREGTTVTVELWRQGRRQAVECSRRDALYIFDSVVVDAAFVTKNQKAWRALASITWQRNAMKDLVTFAFDGRDRLVGRMEQPVATLDPEELKLYIQVLAEECDRFEYVLTGKDQH